MYLSVDRQVTGSLQVADEELDLSAVKSAYLRPCDFRELPAVAQAGPAGGAWLKAHCLQDMLLSWSDLAPALVLNRPSHMSSNNSKPYQALCIESLGFRTPRTLITTDPQAARQFWSQYGNVIYKSLSGVRSIVSRLSEEHAARFDDISTCPTQFQQYIEGTEYRVHVVGDEVFPTCIASAADDYRYAAETAGMQACELPVAVSARCRELSRALKLTLSGIDLRQGRDGHWYCLEVNPSPGFTYFEDVTGQPIAAAIARLLMDDK